jgi:hypothetical protein
MRPRRATCIAAPAPTDLTIGFAPEYRYADGTEWIPVSGVIWVPANRLVAEAAAGAKTVLVEDECTVNPSGPGC